MRIVIDLQGAQSTSLTHGAGGHSMALAKVMAQLKGEHHITIALNSIFGDTLEPIRAAFDGLISQDDIRLWSMPTPATASKKSDRWRREAAEILREEFLASLQPDIVHITGIFNGFDSNAVHSIGSVRNQFRTAVTVYDALPDWLANTNLKSADAHDTFYRAQLAHLKRADFFLRVNESSRIETAERLGVASERCVNIGAAVGPQFIPGEVSPGAIDRLKKKLAITRSVLMCADAMSEKNNFLRLIKAFSLLPVILRKSHQLVVVGDASEATRSEFDKSLLLFGLPPDCVVITGHIKDEELVRLYRSCALFIAPAAVEGFGFAALEAMSCGAPVIGSDTRSATEILANPQALFNPLDAAAISTKIAEVLYNEQFRAGLVSHGLAQAKKFSWDSCGLKALAGLEVCLRLPRSESLSSPLGRSPSQAMSTVKVLADSLQGSHESMDAGIVQKIASIRNADASDSDWFSTARAIAVNHPEPGKPKLLIDISELVYRDAKTGIQRVVRSILFVLLTEPPVGFDVRPVYLCTSDFVYKYADDFVCKILDQPRAGVVDMAANWSYRDVFLGLDLQHEIVLAHQAVYDNMRRFGVKVYFVVYDLLPLLFPKAFRKGTDEVHEQWLSVLARSDGVVAISRTVADDIAQWLVFAGPALLRPLKIGWFHLGADVAGSVPTTGMPIDSADVLRAIASRPAFLTVGTIEPRKGHLQTLVAFELLWAQGVDVSLVIVGKHGWSVDLLVGLLRTHSEMGKRLFWLDGVSDEYLEKVYASCVCLVAASEGEGFGLPLIEAAQHSLPIIARDIPVFREVAGNHAHYFANTLDPAAISDGVKIWMALNANAGKIAREPSGINWLTWKQSAAELMAVVLGGSWYKTSSPDGVHRFWGSGSRLQTNVGKRVGREMLSTGQKGHLLFGPYIPLAHGSYRILINGALGANGAAGVVLEAACNEGETILGKANLHEHSDDGVLSAFEVTLADDVLDFEIRMWVTALTSVSVSMVSIEPIERPVDT